jgi:hypothetical protein
MSNLPFRRARRVAVFALLFVIADAAQTRAWDPWNNIIKPAAEGVIGGVKAAGNLIGGAIGAPFGGLLGGLAQPTIDSAEAAGHRVVGQVDEVMTKQLDKLDKIADKQIGNFDARLEKRIGQFDANLGARIAQIDTTIGQRLDQVNGMVTASISEVDSVIKTRLDQLDEIAATRIGTLDIIATKTALTFEQTLIRVLGAGCILVFVAAALWVLYRQLTDAWSQTPHASWLSIIRTRWARILGQELGIAAAVACLFLLVYFLPGSARRKADALTAEQDAAYGRAVAAMDFQQARFHAALMEAVDSSNSTYRAKFLKAELLRDLFNRPGIVSTVAGLNGAILRVNQIESLGAANDPDVSVIKAFILWQSGMTKGAEVEAARLCATALTSAAHDGQFPLRSLALNYLLNYQARPDPAASIPAGNTSELTGFEKAALEDKAITPLTYVFRYDTLVRALDAKVSTAYARMIESHGQLMAAARLGPSADKYKKEAASNRTANAKVVIYEWDTFVKTVQNDPIIAGSAAALAPFLLNDAMYARAAWYVQDADGSRSAAQPAPSLATAPLTTETLPKDIRERLPRVKLAGTLNILNSTVHDFVDSEEYRRFRAFEDALNVFEQKHTLFVLAANQSSWGSPAAPDVVQAAAAEAAIAASRAQVWSDRRPYATSIAEKLQNIGKPYWDPNRWKAADDARTQALSERSLKLL